MLLDTPTGPRVPLASVAKIQEDRKPNFIMREGAQRRIVVQCNVAGCDLQSTVEDIQQRLGIELWRPVRKRRARVPTLAAAGNWCGHRHFSHSRNGIRFVPGFVIIILNLPLALVGGVAGVFVNGRSCANVRNGQI